MRVLGSSAPGKLVLLGEYAVLFGHPAAVMAVNRRASVRLTPSDDASWSVKAPGFEDRSQHFDLDGERGFRWHRPDDEAAIRLSLVERLASALLASGRLDARRLRPAAITLDTTEFFHDAAKGRVKLGLGSSAALTVALVDGLRSWVVKDATADPLGLDELLALHRDFQGGRGSGIDLAASRDGGVLEYRLLEDGRGPVSRQLTLPEDLEMVFVWTGVSASTSSFLAGLDKMLRADGGTAAAAIGDLGVLAAQGINRLEAGDTSSFLGVVTEFGGAMARLGDVAGLPVFSEAHAALRRLTADLPIAYKPSGAGGGDMGIAFTDDPEAAAAFRARTENEGFSCLDLRVDARGLETTLDLQPVPSTVRS